MQIQTTVAGIPCIAQVTHYHYQKPLGRSADSDWDCYGYTEVSFDICDRRGRPAPWLARKATKDDLARIEIEICELAQEGDDL